MNSLIVNFKRRTVAQTAEIAAFEAEVLAKAEQITQVTNAEEQDLAVEAQASLARYIRAVDNSAEAAKKPVNEIRSKIIAWNKDMVSRANDAGMRVASMVNEFQLLEARRVAAAKRAQDEEASALAREMEQKVAVATSIDAQEAIRDEYRDRIAAEAAPIPEVARSNGQRITNDWDITVTDILALFRNHSHCVKLTPILTEIKMLLNDGQFVKGVTAKKILNSGVRLSPEKPAITI